MHQQRTLPLRLGILNMYVSFQKPEHILRKKVPHNIRMTVKFNVTLIRLYYPHKVQYQASGRYMNQSPNFSFQTLYLEENV